MKRLELWGLRWLAFGVSLAVIGGASAEDKFPSKPIRIIVPYAPGGSTDVLARYIGQKMTESWGEQVIVDNRPGGGTVIGATALLKSPPDGHTLLLANNTHVINPHLMTDLPYDALKDFAPVSSLVTSPYLMLINPAMPANNLQEFIALAKSRPSKLNFGTHGVGGLTHLAAELFKLMAGVSLEVVQYKGASPALTGILGGEVDVVLDSPATTINYVQSGKLKAIGITGERRLSLLPQVPTISEAGLPGFYVTVWYGLLARSGTPPAVVTKINTGVGQILERAEVREKLSSLGIEPFPSTQAEFVAWVTREHEKYGRIVKAANIKSDGRRTAQ